MSTAPFTGARVWRETVARRHAGNEPDLFAPPVNLDLPTVSSRDDSPEPTSPANPFEAVGPHSTINREEPQQ